MKMCVFIGLLFLVVASSLSVRAVDNPAQAAARAALEQKLRALETAPANPPTALPPKIVAPLIAPAATSVTVAVPITKPTPPAAIPPAAPPVTPRPKATPPARPLAKTSVAIEKPADNIVTIYGTVYRHAQVEKVKADGLVISYWTANGGFAVTKLDFRMLSPELQKQYQK